MNLTNLAKKFFKTIDQRIGPFDRPLNFRPFPFDAGGALNFLTIGAGKGKIASYVSWDLFGNKMQKRGSLGRYELLVSCDCEQWVLNVITNIARQSLTETFEPGDTLNIQPWAGPVDTIQGIIFEEALKINLRNGFFKERCGLLRCIGVTIPELDYAVKFGVPSLIERLKIAGIYPHTFSNRKSVDLT
jgi:hypothetical protein